jgi:hypothetical protein
MAYYVDLLSWTESAADYGFPPGTTRRTDQSTANENEADA